MPNPKPSTIVAATLAAIAKARVVSFYRVSVYGSWWTHDHDIPESAIEGATKVYEFPNVGYVTGEILTQKELDRVILALENSTTYQIKTQEGESIYRTEAELAKLRKTPPTRQLVVELPGHVTQYECTLRADGLLSIGCQSASLDDWMGEFGQRVLRSDYPGLTMDTLNPLGQALAASLPLLVAAFRARLPELQPPKNGRTTKKATKKATKRRTKR